VIGSNATLEEFLVEWWDTYAVTHLRPNTLATYTTLLDKWIVPYLGSKRLREITRATIDAYAASLRLDGAGAPTINRTLGVLQGVFHRAVEWRRLGWNPVVGVRRVAHSRAETIDARTPETVEAIRSQLNQQNAALVSVLAYEGLRPAEAYALVWNDVLDDRRRPRARLRVQKAISGDEVTTTKSQRGREPELFKPVARELAELYLARGRPAVDALVFPDSDGGHLRRQNWRRRVWIPALERAGVAYFRSYDLRHTCATLLLYEGRTLNEVAEHLGHADPGFTARTYAHVMRDASRRRRITISEAIRKARDAARRRPRVDPSAPKKTSAADQPPKKVLQKKRADARIRTADPFITSEVLYQLSYVGGGVAL
jgi:integrase